MAECEHGLEVATAGAAANYSYQDSGLRPGGFATIGGHPCKITNVVTSKPGKHGHVKMVLTGTDVFTGKQHEGGVSRSAFIAILFSLYSWLLVCPGLRQGFPVGA